MVFINARARAAHVSSPHTLRLEHNPEYAREQGPPGKDDSCSQLTGQHRPSHYNTPNTRTLVQFVALLQRKARPAEFDDTQTDWSWG